MKSSQANSPENIIEQWANYFNAGNLDGISDMYHNESTLLPTFLPKLLSSKNEIKGYFNVAFKPPSTIKLPQNTVDRKGISSILKAKGRHDPCVVNRAVPIVESMVALILLDNILIQKSRK